MALGRVSMVTIAVANPLVTAVLMDSFAVEASVSA